MLEDYFQEEYLKIQLALEPDATASHLIYLMNGARDNAIVEKDLFYYRIISGAIDFCRGKNIDEIRGQVGFLCEKSA